MYSVPELGERDIVKCFKHYLRLIPSNGPFYRRPSTSTSGPPCFTRQVVGKNNLNGPLKNFCVEAGIKGNFSGHSGKVTCATQLLENMVDEQLIQMHTGHRSTDGVRVYKRPTEFHGFFSHLQPRSSFKKYKQKIVILVRMVLNLINITIIQVKFKLDPLYPRLTFSDKLIYLVLSMLLVMLI